jgi:hypothetical protein
MVTEKYLEACAADAGLRDVMAKAEFPEALYAAWGKYFLPRPLFCAEDRIRHAAADVAGLFELMVSLPDRLFGGDVRKYCAAIGADERRTRLGLTHVDTPAAMARQFAEATGKESPVVATVEAVDGMSAYYESLHGSFQETMRRYGVETVYGELDEVRVEGGRVHLRDRPIDLLLRYFSVNQVARDPRNDEYVEAVTRAHEEGHVVLWTPLNSALLSFKTCLPLVSDPDFRADLSAEENALIDRILPWTRTLTPELADFVRAERDQMILKPFAGLAGQGIRVGWEQTDREWAETVAACQGGDHIVQRRVDPAPEPVMNPETGEVEDWRAVWGIFAFPAGYGGVLCRALPPGTGSVVNLQSKGAKVASAFHY